MRRRTLLAMPAVAATAGVLAACQPREDDGVSEDDPDVSDQRSEYGSDPSQYGGLYLPDGGGAAAPGVVVVVHGGFWRSEYDLGFGAPLAADLARRGWVAWNLEYRRVGNGGGVPETLLDVSAGIDHLRELEIDLGDRSLDDVPIIGLGHSAGGHLVTWAAGPGREAVAGEVAVPLTHVISQAGVLDLRAADEADLGQGAVAQFLGHAASTDDRDVDPAQQLPLDVPVWCVHGDGDTIVPPSQSADYVDAATAAGASAELVEVAGDHFVVIDVESDAWSATIDILDGIAG